MKSGILMSNFSLNDNEGIGHRKVHDPANNLAFIVKSSPIQNGKFHIGPCVTFIRL